MNNEEVVRHFKKTMSDNPDMSEAIAATKTLMEFIRHTSSETLQGLIVDLKKAIESLTATDYKGCITSIASGCELFLHFITLSTESQSLDNLNFKQCTEFLIQRGEKYLENIGAARGRITRDIGPFIREKMIILTHSRSRVVLQLLKESSRKNLTVYVTQSMPDKSGVKMAEELTEAGINAILILDAEVGSIMERIGLVIVGAEGVAQSGGIINKIGSFNIAVLAKNMNKPVYVVAESFKFVRVYPLNQRDLPAKFKYPASKLISKADLTHEHAMVDYTPPSYITLLFTDIGILPPTAVSDELIKLYL